MKNLFQKRKENNEATDDLDYDSSQNPKTVPVNVLVNRDIHISKIDESSQASFSSHSFSSSSSGENKGRVSFLCQW